MKHTSLTIGITLLLTMTNPLCSNAEHERTNYRSAVPWINPDGLRGVAVMSADPKPTVAWTNLDGTEQVVERYEWPASGSEYAWVNPDGHTAQSVTALNGGQYGNAVGRTPNRPDVPQYNDKPLYAVTKGNEPNNMLTVLLPMLVAGSALLVARRLWPH